MACLWRVKYFLMTCIQEMGRSSCFILIYCRTPDKVFSYNPDKLCEKILLTSGLKYIARFDPSFLHA